MTAAGGPTPRQAAGLWLGLFRDPLAVYDALRREYGDAVRLPMTPRRTFHLLSRPEHFEHVLVTHQDRYVKAWTYKPLKAFLGDGLLTSEGETWQRHRRLVQPVFSHRHVQAFAPEIVAAARARTATWRPGTALDVAAEMRTLTWTSSAASCSAPTSPATPSESDVPSRARRTRSCWPRCSPG